jgi:hypothetical protein
MDVDLSANELGYFVQIRLVATRHDDVRETGTVGSQQPLLDASNRKSLADRPRYCFTSAGSTATGIVSWPASARVATLRSSLPIWRSRPRTPASRV